MKWQDIKNSSDNTHFIFHGEPLFNKRFVETLKFHSPGIAPVKDETGYYHINVHGEPIYTDRFERAFGFYCNRASVVKGAHWFHIDNDGKRVYSQNYAWCGNYQENLCVVRDFDNSYLYIDMDGNDIYNERYLYCGDFKDGFACVKLQSGHFKHIDSAGNFINGGEFADLGVFHKKFATARDAGGWFHVDISGKQLYSRRFASVEPFYNGQAKVELCSGGLEIIGERGETVIKIE